MTTDLKKLQMALLTIFLLIGVTGIIANVFFNTEISYIIISIALIFSLVLFVTYLKKK